MNTYVALVSGHGWHVADLARAAASADMRLETIPFAGLTARVGAEAPPAVCGAGIRLDDCAGILVRMMPPGSLEQVVFRMDALHRLQAAGVPVLNPPAAVEAAVDKYLTLARVQAHGLAVPPTWVGESPDDALAAFEALGGDVVVKPLFGSEGRGMVRVDDIEILRRVVHAVSRIGGILYLQARLDHVGHDLRLFVLGDRVVAAMRRFPRDGDWRTNASLGGRAVAFRPDPECIELALAAARAVGARMAGVDLLPTRDGRLVVLEVNAVPGWRALAAAGGIDIAAEILAELRSPSR